MINIEYLEKVARNKLASTSEAELEKKRLWGLPYNNYLAAGLFAGTSAYNTNKGLKFIPKKYRYPISAVSGSLGAATGFDLQEAWDHIINNKVNNIKTIANDSKEYLLSKLPKNE